MDKPWTGSKKVDFEGLSKALGIMSFKKLTLSMLAGLPLKFPYFDIYSTPLLLFMLQGAVFAFLLFMRGRRHGRLADYLLGAVVLITCYERTHYAIGFMEWYDTYRNTKVNYFLIDLTLLLGPIIYFYVQSVTVPGFKLGKKQYLQFIPFALYAVYCLFLYIYDAAQPGFDDTQNGELMASLHLKYIDKLMFIVFNLSMMLYLTLAIQQFYNYRKRIAQYYSNTYRLQFNWIRIFLIIYASLFLYQMIQTVVEETIVVLHWKQRWWYHLLSAVIVVYVGIKGYFTDTVELSELKADGRPTAPTNKAKTTIDANPELQAALLNYMQQQQPHLNPELTLSQLAIGMNLPRTELSDLLNKNLGKNFNDFVNSYRIEAFKEMIQNGKHNQLSVLGLAEEAGFNSKATFNRVFKKHTQMSPTEYINSL